MTDEENDVSVFVTGASGFIGSAVVRELCKRSIPVVAMSRRRLLSRPGVITCWVRDYTDFEVPEGAIVLHVAGESDVGAANLRGDLHFAAELQMATAICRSRAGRIIYASSAQVYGSADSAPHRPDGPAANSTPYALTKIGVERLVVDRAGVAARLSNIYGPGTSGTLIADIVAQIPGRGPLLLRETQSKRDFLWLADAARGLVDMALGTANGVYNLAYGEIHSAGEVARTALALSGGSAREIKVFAPNQKPSTIAVDISSMVEKFGWRPHVSLKDGLRELVAARIDELESR